MVIAISGFTPELLAVLESITAQRHFGFWPNFLTAAQQLPETEAFSSCAADAQGASLNASMLGSALPHSRAPFTSPNPAITRARRSPNRHIFFIEPSMFA
ncbi:hypothetical protein Hanom_Chr07g00673411 [Helianthus anomalus]